jgi:hypothetical protein
MKQAVVERDLYSIGCDPAKHRIYLQLRGFWATKARVPEFAADLEKIVTEFANNGFTAIIDVREFNPPLPDVASLHIDCQKMLKSRGLRKAAAICRETPQELACKKYAYQADVRLKSFAREEDAELWLDCSN